MLITVYNLDPVMARTQKFSAFLKAGVILSGGIIGLIRLTGRRKGRNKEERYENGCKSPDKHNCPPEKLMINYSSRYGLCQALFRGRIASQKMLPKNVQIRIAA